MILSGCAGKNADEKAILDDILKTHDKVMANDEQLTKNKMQIDTLLKQGKLPGNDSAKIISKRLAIADSVMDKWMHDFEPDQSKKTHDDAVKYMNEQKKQIMAIDTQLNQVVAESSKYLSKIKMK